MLQPLNSRLSLKAGQLCLRIPFLVRAAVFSSWQPVSRGDHSPVAFVHSPSKSTVCSFRSFIPPTASGPDSHSIHTRLVSYQVTGSCRGYSHSMSSSAAPSFESFAEGDKIKEILVFWFGDWADPSKVRPRKSHSPQNAAVAVLAIRCLKALHIHQQYCIIHTA